MWWYRHPSFVVTAGGSWFSRVPLVTALFISLTDCDHLVCRVCRAQCRVVLPMLCCLSRLRSVMPPWSLVQSPESPVRLRFAMFIVRRPPSSPRSVESASASTRCCGGDRPCSLGALQTAHRMQSSGLRAADDEPGVQIQDHGQVGAPVLADAQFTRVADLFKPRAGPVNAGDCCGQRSPQRHALPVCEPPPSLTTEFSCPAIC